MYDVVVFVWHCMSFVCITIYYVMVRCNDIHLAKRLQYALLSLVGPSYSSRIGLHIGRDIDKVDGILRDGPERDEDFTETSKQPFGHDTLSCSLVSFRMHDGDVDDELVMTVALMHTH